MRSLARPGDGVSLAATQGQDRSSFDTEPGLRSSRFFFVFAKAHLFFGADVLFCIFLHKKSALSGKKCLFISDKSYIM
jgi:hypothetical protein